MSDSCAARRREGGELSSTRLVADGGGSPPDAAVSVDLNTERLDVVGTVRTACEVAKVELDLVPALVQAHRHGADERLHSRRRLLRGARNVPCVSAPYRFFRYRAGRLGVGSSDE